MSLVACALPLLAGAPSMMAAQVTIALPRVQRPVVRATLGPVALVATLGGRGVSVRATPTVAHPTAPTRTVGEAHATAAGILATARRYLGTHYRYGGGGAGSRAPGSGCAPAVF